MADIVCELFPEAKLAIGPATEQGFYYDFQINNPFTPDDLKLIESRMALRIHANLPFEKQVITREEALGLFSTNPFKLEIIEGLDEGTEVSLYKHGNFVDLCQGPHVEGTGDIHAFKLLEIAGAYWRGDERNPMLQRIYGTAFESETELSEYLEAMEQARTRDHRRLGREMGLYFIDPVAPASPFFLPNGTTVYNLLVAYVRNLYIKHGYEEVRTPQLFSTELWKKSGHYDHYIENMYVLDVDDREFGIKPMNCPAHAMIYASQRRSYRELPMRLADFGMLHRHERSGVTHGLTRVRTFSQDDAHIFCSEDQIGEEVSNFIGMLLEAYQEFGFTTIRPTLSLRPGDRVGSDVQWDRAEDELASVLGSIGLEYQSVDGEGAFYGPKIDFFVSDALGREWQLGTIQLDFSLPERFDLNFVDQEGNRQRPVVIHRAMLGSLERFLGVFIEHCGGALPVWLAPVQAIIIPIADRHIEYCTRVLALLQQQGIRADIDARNDRMNAKIRDAQVLKTPYMLIIGDREMDQDQVTVRFRTGESIPALSKDKLIKLLVDTTESRSWDLGQNLAENS
jgi:threonyl-tRNA synthetase